MDGLHWSTPNIVGNVTATPSIYSTNINVLTDGGGMYNVNLDDGTLYIYNSAYSSSPYIASPMGYNPGYINVNLNGTIRREYWSYDSNIRYQWTKNLPTNISSSPVNAYGKLFVAGENGVIYAFTPPFKIGIANNILSNSPNGIYSYSSSLQVSGNNFNNVTTALNYSGMFDYNSTIKDNNISSSTLGLFMNSYTYALVNSTHIPVMRFNDIYSMLAFENNSILLKTRVNQSGNITREILQQWNNSYVKFNDTGQLTTTYEIRGLKASTNYKLYNNSVQFATSATNSIGVLPSFSISLASEHEIIVQEQVIGSNLTVSLYSPQNTLITNNATITFNCSVSSGNQLTNITLYGNWSGWSAKNSTNITGTSNSSQWTNTLSDGSYLWNCLAYDSTGNSSFAASNYTLTIDTVKPVLTFVNITPNNTQTANSWAFINITSSESLSTALLEWNGTAPNLTMQGSGTNWYYNKTGLVNGNYTFKVYANDTANNWNVTETRWVYVNYTAGYPQYSNISVNTTQKNSSALFSAYWTDVVGLSGFVFSTNNSGAWQNQTYAFTGTANWSNATITLNSTIGLTIGYVFYANNTNANWNNTGVQTLTVSCAESWSYSAWSACSGSVQARTATDANSCGTTVNRSAISQSCSSGTTGSSGGGGGGGGSTTTKTITVTPNEPLTKVVVNLKTSIESPSLTVAKVETVPVSPQEPVYQYINITKSNFNNTQIENATIDFKVNRSWISANNFTRIWLAHYENGWTKLKTDLINSNATVNYYRAYTDAFSYFAIIGEKAEAAQTSPPAPEPPKEPVKNETTAEQAKQPQTAPASPLEPPKSYPAYVIAVLILIIAGYALKGYIKKSHDILPMQDSPDVAAKEKTSCPHPRRTECKPLSEEKRGKARFADDGKKPPEQKKKRVTERDTFDAEDEKLDDIQRRLEEIKRKLNEK